MKRTFLPLALFVVLAACGKKDNTTEETATSTAAPATEAPAATATSSEIPAASEAAPATTASAAIFDISTVPVTGADLGKFPYLSGLQGYEVNTLNSEDLDFDRSYIYDGKQLVPVEGKVSRRIFDDQGKKASELMIMRNYENLLKDLGATTVFVGKTPREAIDKVGGYDAVYKHGGKWSISPDRETATYVIRQKDKEVWVQVTPLGSDGDYALDVLERAAMPQQVTTIKADELKKN